MINHLLILLIQVFRPLLGPATCKFSQTCGNYSVAQLREKPLLRAIANICKRLLACSPLYRFFPSE